MANRVGASRLALGCLVAAAFARPAFAHGGGGPPVWTMTLNYCREMVVKKGITDVNRFQQEVAKCVADPVTYPPTYK